MDDLRIIAKVRYDENEEFDSHTAIIWDQDKSAETIWSRLKRRLSEQGYDVMELPLDAPAAIKRKEKEMHGLRLYNEIMREEKVHHLFVGIYYRRRVSA